MDKTQSRVHLRVRTFHHASNAMYLVYGTVLVLSVFFFLRISSIQLHYTPIVATQVRSLARAVPPPEPSWMEEGACTDVLSLVQRCASSMDGTISQGGGISLDPGASPLVSPEVE